MVAESFLQDGGVQHWPVLLGQGSLYPVVLQDKVAARPAHARMGGVVGALFGGDPGGPPVQSPGPVLRPGRA